MADHELDESREYRKRCRHIERLEAEIDDLEDALDVDQVDLSL